MEKLSQRDSRWASIKLGDSNYTIGGSGCTITCLAMAAGLTPDVINSKMNAVGGLKNGLVNWTLIGKANIGLEFIWRNVGWDNDKVLKAIADYGFCLAETDFDGNPKTTGRHWILLIGNKKAYDPYTGTEISTSKYPIFTGYAILKKVAESTNMMQIEESKFSELVGKSTKYDEFVKLGYNSAEQVKVKVAELSSTIGDHEKEITDLKTEIKNLSEAQTPAVETEAGYVEAEQVLGKMLPNGGRKTTRDDGTQEIEISYKLKD